MLLELKNVHFKRENKKILDNINLKLDLGKFIAITGPDSGQIIFNGTDITKLSIDKRANLGISFAFQQPVKFKGITVYDLLKMAAKKEMTKIEACEVLSKVGLCAKEYVDREVNGSLSGGELKRIEIATVALRRAQLTIFDEPEAGIDLWSFSNLIDVFEKMGELIKGTTLIISHQERILNIADEVILMKAGKIEEIGESKEILSKTFAKTECYKVKK